MTSTERALPDRCWPGTDPNRGQDAKYHPDLGRVLEPALQRDAELQPCRLRGRPAADRGGRLRRRSATGTRARSSVNPPPGANFYPIYSTGSGDPAHGGHGSCSLAPRWEVHRRGLRTRSVATRRPSTGRSSPEQLPEHRLRAPLPLQQLPAGAEHEPLRSQKLTKESMRWRGVLRGAPRRFRALRRGSAEQPLVQHFSAGRAHLALDLVPGTQALWRRTCFVSSVCRWAFFWLICAIPLRLARTPVVTSPKAVTVR